MVGRWLLVMSNDRNNTINAASNEAISARYLLDLLGCSMPETSIALFKNQNYCRSRSSTTIVIVALNMLSKSVPQDHIESAKNFIWILGTMLAPPPDYILPSQHVHTLPASDQKSAIWSLQVSIVGEHTYRNHCSHVPWRAPICSGRGVGRLLSWAHTP